MEKKPFAARMKEVFGASITSREFMEDYKKLTQKDKEDFCDWLNEAGMATERPSGK